MDIQGIDRFWVKTSIGSDGALTTLLAVLTRVPLHPAEAGFDETEADRLLAAIRDFQRRHGFHAVEIVSGQGA